jgi:hypothetical protein
VVAGTGLNGNVTVTAYDASGNVLTNYVGSVYFTSSDPQAILPFTISSPYTFTSADQGVHDFSGLGFILKTVGNQNITVTDESSGISANLTITVGAKLVFTVGANQTINAGQMSNLITIQREDGNGNPYTVGWTCVYLETNQAPFLNYSTGSYGNFYYTNGSLMDPSLPSILITPASSSASFYYEDEYNGNWTLTADSDGSFPYIPAGYVFGAGLYMSLNVTLPDGTWAILYLLNPQIQSDATTSLYVINGITPAVFETMIFTESGLPIGTSWSVTVGSNQYSSTTNTITVNNLSATIQNNWSVSNSIANGVSYSPSPFAGGFGAWYNNVYANGVVWGSAISDPPQQITFSPIAASSPTPSPTPAPSTTLTPTSTPTPTAIPTSTPSPTPKIPEFPSIIILALLVTAMFAITVEYKRKKAQARLYRTLKSTSS